MKKHEKKAYLEQQMRCAAPVRWSKYTTDLFSDPHCTWFLWSILASSSWQTGPTCMRSELPRRWLREWWRCRDRQRTRAHHTRHEWPPAKNPRTVKISFKDCNRLCNFLGRWIWLPWDVWAAGWIVGLLGSIVGSEYRKHHIQNHLKNGL